MTIEELRAELLKLVGKWDARAGGNISPFQPYVPQYLEKLAYRDCAEELAQLLGKPLVSN